MSAKSDEIAEWAGLCAEDAREAFDDGKPALGCALIGLAAEALALARALQRLDESAAA